MNVRGALGLLWSRHRLLTIAFAVALGFTVFFTARSIAFYVYWANHRDLPIEGWMPVGYVAHSYALPPPALEAALGLEPRDRRPLARIARERGVPLSDLIAQVEAAIADARKAAGAPGAPIP